MNKKVFYLKNCDTCRKIIASLNLEGWEMREIKSEPITREELDEMRKLSGSYEEIFSKKSTQIRARNLDVSKLSDEDLGRLILEHYSFLKRPVFLIKDKIFAGSSKKTIESLKEFLEQN